MRNSSGCARRSRRSGSAAPAAPAWNPRFENGSPERRLEIQLSRYRAGEVSREGLHDPRHWPIGKLRKANPSLRPISGPQSLRAATELVAVWIEAGLLSAEVAENWGRFLELNRAMIAVLRSEEPNGYNALPHRAFEG